MTSSRADQAKLLLVIIVAFFAISNTIGDGNALGGIAFVVWALAALALIALGVKTALERRHA
jgi:heme exporter protein D